MPLAIASPVSSSRDTISYVAPFQPVPADADSSTRYSESAQDGVGNGEGAADGLDVGPEDGADDGLELGDDVGLHEGR